MNFFCFFFEFPFLLFLLISSAFLFLLENNLVDLSSLDSVQIGKGKRIWHFSFLEEKSLSVERNSKFGFEVNLDHVNGVSHLEL